MQRHKLPSNASSTACSDGVGSFRSNAYRLFYNISRYPMLPSMVLSEPSVLTITIPGVQKPHWLPLPTAIRCWIAWGFLTSPSPSTVMTCFPSTETRGAIQALTEAWYIFFVVWLRCETTCVLYPRLVKCPNLASFDSETYHCTSTAASFSTSKLGPRQSDTSQVFQKCEFWIDSVNSNFCAVQVEPNSIVPLLSKLSERSHLRHLLLNLTDRV